MHQLLLKAGKSWLQWSGPKPTAPGLRVHSASSASRYDLGEALVVERVRAVAISQLAKSLRMQGAEGEAETMLTSLESLASAGEITFRDYIGRVQNLFPNALNQIDVPLRMKIASLMVD